MAAGYGSVSTNAGARQPKKLRNVLTSHLWANGPVPWEFVEYFLCKNVFHCTYAELRAMEPADILTTLTILDVEAAVRKMG
jgi:hypothetical protein